MATEWRQGSFKGQRVFIEVDSKTNEVVFASGRLIKMTYKNKPDVKGNPPKVYNTWVENKELLLPSGVKVPAKEEGKEKQEGASGGGGGGGGASSSAAGSGSPRSPTIFKLSGKQRT